MIDTSRRLWILAPLATAAAAALSGCFFDTSSDSSDAGTGCEILTDAGGTVVVGSGLPGDPAAPEPASGYRVGKKVVYTSRYMVATANPLASKAGCEVLKSGGSAVDAAVAVQAVLGLVEPQSSGIGGGAFMLHFDAKTKAVTAYDGRETAPAAATENYIRWIDDATNRTTPVPSARASGRSIGVPGAVRMLGLAHAEHGKKPWKDLFQPGIDLATNGFPISGRMADAIAGARTNFLRDKDATAAYLKADGSAKQLGETFTLPAYAATLTTLANGGADALYNGALAQAIVAKAGVTVGDDPAATPITPSKLTLSDLSGYQAKKREAICTTYRGTHMICGMPPPSSGGITVASIMGILENFDMAQYKPTAIDLEGGKPTVLGVHLTAEAGRLAYADRNAYIADTDFVPLPGNSPDTLLNKPYLQSRAGLISLTSSIGIAQPGNFNATPVGISTVQEAGTTHFSIVDRQGNAVSMTTTVEAGFGSYHMTNGFILNNQLTDFDAPADANGNPIANRPGPGKRPRSSMAPTLVFKLDSAGKPGDFVMATGSPGGATIIQYVAKTLVGALDWGLNAQQATSLVDFGAANSRTTSLGGEHPNIDETNNGANDPLVTGLRALGHTVSVSAQSSGISTIMRDTVNGRKVWAGGADPRREGLVLGDAINP
ncbi:gamma-glutamyltransferase [Aquincola sp. MAHUQ-54]|uniref:Glutathione hydrolase proenzyme n=1 Tax=Aquincola agrisoli TaxID=3119538 RepID=A0AAW9QPN2_9BURK